MIKTTVTFAAMFFTATLFAAHPDGEPAVDSTWIAAAAFCLLTVVAAGAMVLWFRKQAHAAEWKQRRSEAILRAMPVHFCVTDSSGRILMAHAEDSMQDEVEAATKVRDLPGVQDNADEILARIYETARTGVPTSADLSNLKRRSIFRIMPGGIFEKNAVIWCSYDVSPEYQLQARLKEHDLARRCFLSHIPVGVIFFDRRGTVVEINSMAEKLLDVAGANITGMPQDRLFAFSTPQNSGADEFSPIAKAIETLAPSVSAGIVNLILYNGKELAVTCSATPMPDAHGENTGVIFIFNDETATLAEAEAARKRDKALNEALELTKSGYFRFNVKSRETEVCPGFERLWPFRNSMPVPEKEWVYPEDFSDFITSRDNLISGASERWTFNFRSNYFGAMCYYRLSGTLEYDERGDAWIFGAIQDVSALKETFSHGNEDTFLLKSLVNALPCPFFVEDISNEYRFVLASESVYAFLDVKENELLGKKPQELKGDGELIRQMHEIALETNRSSSFVSKHITWSDRTGKVQHFRVIEKAQLVGNGRKMLFGICLDETNEEDIRLQMESQRHFYEELLNRLPAGICVKRSDNFRYVVWNRMFEEQTGYRADHVLGKSDMEISPYPDAKDKFHAAAESVARDGVPIRDKHHLVSATGKEGWYEVIHALMQSSGKNYNITLFLDISREHKIELERQETLNKLNSSLVNASIINASLKKMTRELDFDSSVNDMLQILGGSAHADRCYIYQYSEDMKFASCQFEWVRVGISAQIERHKEMDATPFKSWTKKLLERKIVQIDDIESASAEWRDCIDLLKVQNIKSLLVLGIYHDDKLRGFIGIDAVRQPHTFNDGDIHLLSDAVSIFQIAYSRLCGIRAIEESAAVQKLIINMVQLPLTLLNADFTIAHANPASLKMSNTKLEDVVGKFCYQKFCHCSEPPETGCAILKTLEAGKPLCFERDIGNVHYTVNTVPIFHNGKIVQVLESFIDMTEIDKGRKLLEKTAADADAAARAKSMFLATMSHELRTPLNAVIGFSELLKLGDMEKAEHDEAINSIYLAGTTLLNLINDILDLSKLEAGQMKMTPEMTDLGRIIEELRTVFSVNLKEKHLTGVFEIPPILPNLRLDGLRIRQILLNLIGNSIKFTQEGGITVSVEFVKSDEHIGDLTIRVKDTGIGISPEYQDKIFQPFVQESTRVGSVSTGTGLGLPICKRLIDQMKGRLTLQSIPGKGSCFTVILPRIAYRKADSSRENMEPEAIPVFNGRALLIDDVKMNLKVMERMAAKIELVTRSAANGNEALKLIDEFKPTIIFTDMWMSGMNGAELAAEVRANPAWSQIKIVAVSADTELGNPDGKSFFDGILLKPLTIGKLVKTLQSLNSVGGAQIVCDKLLASVDAAERGVEMI